MLPIPGEGVRYVYDLHDVYDAATQTSSMARTTGYACTSMVQLVLDGTYAVVGVSAPEVAGRAPGILDKALAYQAKRNIHYIKTRTAL
jgi:lysine 6-dehydrogenase